MNTRICFFTVGFAFNKLVRLRYYEKIFPKNTEIFLITTDKYGRAEEEKKKWSLARTKVIILKHSRKNLFEIRKICDRYRVDAVSNLGHPFGAFALIFASIFRQRKVLLYYLGDVLEIFKTTKMSFKKVKLFSILPVYFLLSKIADKVALVGYNSFRRAPIFFLCPQKKFYYLHGPVNVDLFRPSDKRDARKKIGISERERVIIYVGRISYLKGGDLLSQLIKSKPEIEFIVIGKWNKDEIPLIKSKNLKIIENVKNEDLSKYYSAADLAFVYNRQGDQLQIVGAEAIACGVPVLHTNRVHAPNKRFIIKLSDKIVDFNNQIKSFFALNEKERKDISREAREYALRNLSDEYWKDKYLKFFIR